MTSATTGLSGAITLWNSVMPFSFVPSMTALPTIVSSWGKWSPVNAILIGRHLWAGTYIANDSRKAQLCAWLILGNVATNALANYIMQANRAADPFYSGVDISLLEGVPEVVLGTVVSMAQDALFSKAGANKEVRIAS